LKRGVKEQLPQQYKNRKATRIVLKHVSDQVETQINRLP